MAKLNYRIYFLARLSILLFILSICSKIYAYEIVIGVRVKDTQKIIPSSFVDIFSKKGYHQESASMPDSLIFKKPFQDIALVLLNIEIRNIEGKKIVYFESIDAKTGIIVLFEHFLFYENIGDEFKKNLGDFIAKIEQLKFPDDSCKTNIVALTGDFIFKGKAGANYFELMEQIINHKKISLRNTRLANSIVELQDILILSSMNNEYVTKKIRGHMCSPDISCHITSQDNEILKIKVYDVLDNNVINEINISTLNDIQILVDKIAKFKKHGLN